MRLLKIRVLLVVLAGSWSACGTPAEPTLVINAAPPLLDGLGRTSQLRVVATDADGTTGQGTVTLRVFVGELDDTSLALDEYGSVRTRYTCPATSPGCTPGQPLEVEATWTTPTGDVRRVSRVLRIATPPTVWTPASCPEEARLVYLFTDAAELYSFHPPTKGLTRLGRLACPSAGGTPNSMAVSQDGTGWVNYSDGSLYRVNVRTAACTATSFTPPSGWTRFGMGFSPDSATSPSETLFIAANAGLARVDLSAMKATMVGALGGATTSAELTGTADGRLFGFFVGGAMSLAQVDKSTGATAAARVFPSLIPGTGGFAYAFSSWGPDFYLYTSFSGSPTQVTRYQPATDTDDLYLVMPAGVRVLGAGVSRCGAD